MTVLLIKHVRSLNNRPRYVTACFKNCLRKWGMTGIESVIHSMSARRSYWAANKNYGVEGLHYLCHVMMHDFGHVMRPMATSGATGRKQRGFDACGPGPCFRSCIKTWWSGVSVDSDLYLISSISVTDCRHKKPPVTTCDRRDSSQILTALIYWF